MYNLSFGNSNPYYTRYTLARASSSRNQIPPYRSKADNFWRTNIHLELIYRCLSFGRNSSVAVFFSFKFLNRDGKKLTLQFHQRDIFLLKLLKHTQMLFLKIYNCGHPSLKRLKVRGFFCTTHALNLEFGILTNSRFLH